MCDSDNSKPRKRNAEATKTDIVEAAKLVFCEKGYDGAGTREIAERAGVNVALIARYFGSKEGLFVEAIPPELTLNFLLEDDMANFGERAAALFVGKDPKVGFDPTVALLRAASSPDATKHLRTALHEQVLTPIAQKLEGENRIERAALIGAQLAGYDLSARVIGVKTTTTDDLEPLRKIMAKSLQDIVDG